MNRGRRGGRSVPARRRSRGAWAEVTVVTSEAAAEAAASLLWGLGAGGLAQDAAAAGAVRLRAYLAPSRASPAALRRLRGRIRGLARWGIDPRPGAVRARRTEAARWQRAWRRGLRPVHVGSLIIAARHVRIARRPGQAVIRIDPGMAFGSGAHASTRLALRALVRRRRMLARARVLDVGTGSGVLAIAAARLGARRVLARDLDPVAVAAARANAAGNGAAGAVRVVRGAGAGSGTRRYRVILCNIVADTIIALLPAMARALEADGRLILSGIVDARIRDVAAAARALGLQAEDVLASGEWRAAVFAPRPTAGPPERPGRRPKGAKGGGALQSRSRRVQ